MLLIRTLRNYTDKRSHEYFFGFGADSEAEMIQAVIGRRPEFVSRTYLHDFQLCIQSLEDIPTHGANPRFILQRSWGDTFRSYTIRHHKGETIHGSVFKITRYERRMLDTWELVSEGWQNSITVSVMLNDGRRLHARTQALPDNQNHGQTAEGIQYHPGSCLSKILYV
jgi:hypothetical protein